MSSLFSTVNTMYRANSDPTGGDSSQAQGASGAGESTSKNGGGGGGGGSTFGDLHSLVSSFSSSLSSQNANSHDTSSNAFPQQERLSSSQQASSAADGNFHKPSFSNNAPTWELKKWSCRSQVSRMLNNRALPDKYQCHLKCLCLSYFWSDFLFVLLPNPPNPSITCTCTVLKMLSQHQKLFINVINFVQYKQMQLIKYWFQIIPTLKILIVKLFLNFNLPILNFKITKFLKIVGELWNFLMT